MWTIRSGMRRREHPFSTRCFCVIRDLQPYLTVWPALQTIGNETLERLVCYKGFYNRSSWWKLQSGPLSTVQRHYKRDFGKNARREPTFTLVDFLLLDCPQIADVASAAANEKENSCYNKLLRQVYGTYRVVSVQPHKTVIEQSGILNKVSILHLKLSPTKEQGINKPTIRGIQIDHNRRHNSKSKLSKTRRKWWKVVPLYRKSTW